MADIIKYTGIQTLGWTIGNIKNSAHYKDTHLKVSAASPISGLTSSFKAFSGSSATGITIGNLTDVTSSTYTVTAKGAFLGASSAYTYTGEYSKTVEIRQADNLSSGVSQTIWAGNSTTIQWTDTANAYDKTATISSTATGLTLPTTKRGETNSMSVTGSVSGMSSTVSQTTNVVTITPYNGNVSGGTATSATITVKNPVNTITLSKTTLNINGVGGATDEIPGSASVSASSISNSNGYKVSDNTANITKNNNNVTLDKTSVAHGGSVTVTAASNLTAAATSTLTFAAADGAKTNEGTKYAADKTVTVNVAYPQYSGKSINVGETVTVAANGASSLATGTTITGLKSNDTTKVTVNGMNYTGAAAGETTLLMTTSDGAKFLTGTITVAASIVVGIYKDSTATTACSDANFGDTISVKVTGGKSGETFTLSATGCTFSKSSVTAGEVSIITLPSSGTNGDITVTATPSAGTAASKKVNVQNITFALS